MLIHGVSRTHRRRLWMAYSNSARASSRRPCREWTVPRAARMKEFGGLLMKPRPFTIRAASSASCRAGASSPSSAVLKARTLRATILLSGRHAPAASARSSTGVASGFPARCRAKPSRARACAYQGEAGSSSSSAAAIPSSTIDRTPLNPKVARNSAAEDVRERIPSGSVPSSVAASMTGSHRRTDSASQENAATQAAQCAMTGLAATRSSPSEPSQSPTVVIRPATAKSRQ
jgi:hypothetical protein